MMRTLSCPHFAAALSWLHSAKSAALAGPLCVAYLDPVVTVTPLGRDIMSNTVNHDVDVQIVSNTTDSVTFCWAQPRTG
jgi:hypothetical protein